MAKRTTTARPNPKHAFELSDGHGCLGGDGFEKHGHQITLSPGRQDWSERIAAKREGVSTFIRSTNGFLTGLLAEIEAEQLSWWKAVGRDLGIADKPEFDRLKYTRGRVTLAPPEPEAMPTYRIFTNDRHRLLGVPMYSALKDVEAPTAAVALQSCPAGFTAPHYAPAKAIQWPPENPEDQKWLARHV